MPWDVRLGLVPNPPGFGPCTSLNHIHQTNSVHSDYGVRDGECYCLNCGFIGHIRKECKRAKAMSIKNPTLPRYSSGLGVKQEKSIHAWQRKEWKRIEEVEEEEEEVARADQESQERVDEDFQEQVEGSPRLCKNRAENQGLSAELIEEIQQNEGGQGSDEATSPIPTPHALIAMENEKMEGPRTIGEPVKTWNNKWISQSSPENSDEKNQNNKGDTMKGKIQWNQMAASAIISRDKGLKQKGMQMEEEIETMKDDEGGYNIMELPMEEKEDEPSRMDVEREQMLALEISRKLQLKRKREEPTWKMIEDKEE
ncbi:hypothetical protein PIB30_018323 [Stylosanthes scabra]|uniref:CCHC-type domain-containing protein n=1 Tax=Stylosanthes scabra TaxID=79078 RepID=A0ABU6Z881_9FABA|nr:hypothetical protein [Stylosanthes scabra]